MAEVFPGKTERRFSCKVEGRSSLPPGGGGIVLLVVLWVMIVLTLLGTSFFHLASLDILRSRNDLEKFQARLLAESALQLAVAVLEDESQVGYHDLNSQWAGAGTLFQAGVLAMETSEEGAGMKGVFQVYTDDVYSEEGGTRYGLRDESSKLNLNTATKEMLEKLPHMDAEKAAAVVDWRDPDDRATPDGAEGEYYRDLDDPYDCANAPFQSVPELLEVKGFSPSLLYGEDENRDGVLQTAEDDGDENDPPDNADGKLDRGLLPFLTVNSYSKNVNAEGEKRLNVNTAKNAQIRELLEGRVSKESLRKLIQFRKDKKFENLSQLLTGKGAALTEEEKTSRQQETDKQEGQVQERSPNEEAESKQEENKEEPSGGEKASATLAESTQEGAVLTFDEFKTVVDDLTITDEEVLPGLVNVNTAPKEVLLCLPGMTNRLAERIVERRSSDLGSFATVADLATIEGVDAATFAELLPNVTVRSSVFEALAVGYLPERKAYASVEAKIDLGGDTPRFVYYQVLR